jgi:hypothetical protein
MNENIIYKKALKRAFINQILVPQLIDNKLLGNKKDISMDDEEEITLDETFKKRILNKENIEIIGGLIKELVSKLADTSVELWLKTQTDKKG